MAATVLFGAVFLVVKYFEYSAKFHHGYYPRTNTFLAIYFTLTGLHGLHVIGGMAVNAYLWGPGSALWKTDPAHFTNRVENAGNVLLQFGRVHSANARQPIGRAAAMQFV